MRHGKLGEDRSYPAYMVGYVFTSVEFKQYYVVRNYGKGVYGKVRLSKDVVFDDYQHYLERTTNDYPLDPNFVLDETPDADPVAIPVPLEPAPAAPDPHHGIFQHLHQCLYNLTLRQSTLRFYTLVRSLTLCTGTTSAVNTKCTSTHAASH